MCDTVSVVIPWGKAGLGILKSIDSALNQSVYIESVVVLGNGHISQDDCNTLASLYVGKKLLIEYLPNCRNANFARNYGAELVGSKWVAYLDSDDWWENTHIESSLKAAKSTHSDFVYSGMNIYGEYEGKLVASDFTEHGNMETYLLSYRPAQTSSYLVLRTAVLNLRWDETLRRHQDYDFIARAAKKYRVKHKEDITVNVIWDKPRRHKFHADCFRLLRAWKNDLPTAIYRNHFLHLWVSGRSSGDKMWIITYPKAMYYRIIRKIECMCHDLMAS